MFLDPGLGKTSITLCAITELIKRGVISKVLLIAPLRVIHSVWPAEAAKWEQFNGLRVSVLHGKNKASALEADADIYAINPEGLEWLLQPTKTKSSKGRTSVSIDLRRFKKFGFDTLVIDELTKFKSYSSVRFKLMELVLGTFARRWGLTGSPAANGLEQLFGQCYMLDEGRTLGRYITHYREKYFSLGYDGFTWTLKPGAEQEIYKRIEPIALRIGDDVLDMPQLVTNVIKVDLPPKAEKIYTKLKKEALVKLSEGKVTAVNAAVIVNKLRQICGGAIYLEPDVAPLLKLPPNTKKVAELHDAKLDALELLIEELQGSPLLVAYDFKHDLSRIKKRLGDVPHIGGGVSPKRAAEIERAWNAGEIPVLLGHPMSMGHGLNLQQCGNHICWFNPIFNYELDDQFNRRVYRQGNTSKRVYVHRLIAKNTIDEQVLGALIKKKTGQDELFDALKNL